MLTQLPGQDWMSQSLNMRFSVSDLLTCVYRLCVKEWQQSVEPVRIK